MKLVLSILLLFASAWNASAQSPPWDTSGNRLLNGAYNFRQVYYATGDDAGNLSRAIAVWGTITFNGTGGYNISNGSVLDSQESGVRSLSLTGTYAVSASGFGFMDSPALSGARLFGLVSQGIFVASSTEDENDLFVAAAAPSPPATNASFSGSYWIGEMNFPALTAVRARDVLYRINPNGSGGVGAITATGFIGGSGNRVTQNVTGASYSFSAGAGTLNLGGTPTNTTLLAGSRILYISQDGNFVFGGSNATWDIFVGVRALSGAAQQSALEGLYYTAGLDEDLSTPGEATMDSYFGAFSARQGILLGHQRLRLGSEPTAFDYTYSDEYTLESDGSHEDFLGFRHVVGAAGAIRIGVGQQTYLGIHVGLRAPSFSGTGVYLNPTGVVNAASYSPFTVGVSPGCLIRLYGTNLASATRVDTTFPTTLAGVQVLFNNRLAPILAVSPTELAVVAPWATLEAVVAIQVLNGGTASNVVTVFSAPATLGIFTQTQNGVGIAAALRPDFSVITAQNPARAGETVAVFLTGLGEVTPPVADGAAGPVNPLSTTIEPNAVFIRGRRADVAFSGLAPQLIGLYQMNVTIPAETAAGFVFFNLATPDAFNSQVVLPVARPGGSSSDVESFGLSRESGTRPAFRRGRPIRPRAESPGLPSPRRGE